MTKNMTEYAVKEESYSQMIEFVNLSSDFARIHKAGSVCRRLVQTASLLDEETVLGMEFDLQRNSEASAFFQRDTKITEEDLRWILGDAASLKGRMKKKVSGTQGEQRIYALCRGKEQDPLFAVNNTECCTELLEALKDTGALIRIIPGRKENRNGMILIMLKQEMPLYVKVMAARAFGGALVKEADSCLEEVSDEFLIPVQEMIEDTCMIMTAYMHLDSSDTKSTVKTSETEEQDQLSELKSAEIDQLAFTVRTSNCLKRAGISTIGDLLQYSDHDLQHIRNLGKKQFAEIKNKLAELSLTNKKEDEEDVPFSKLVS